MKAKLVSKIFVLFICVIFFASAIAAQEKPEAVFIGEYNVRSKNPAAFEAMVEKLIVRLLSEPATTSGIIGIYEQGELGDKVKAILPRYPQLKNKISYGLGKKSGIPQFSDVAFWIMPKDADYPDLGCVMPVCYCPTLNVSGVEFFDSRTEYPTFTATAKGGEEDVIITYKWKVSAGKIIEGQGTPVIKVDAEGAKEITATVEINAVCEECPREALFTTKIQ